LADVSEETSIHVVIPDTQVEPGDPVDHLGWVGEYLIDQFAGKPNITFIHLGDHATMRSLSVHDSPGEAEGRRYSDDIESANHAFDVLNAPLERYNARRRRNKEKQWQPAGKHILLGNHENHITRACGLDPRLKNTLSLDDLNFQQHGWTVHDFLEIVMLGGVSYSHYFVNNANGRPVTGMIETRIKTIGCSFTQGHQQGLKVGMMETHGGRRRGIVAGSCYLKNEDYRGPQAQHEWRGILVCHQVDGDGDYDLMEVSLDYLCRRYEGVKLDKFMAKRYNVPWIS
jgi:hypothetical protein